MKPPVKWTALPFLALACVAIGAARASDPPADAAAGEVPPPGTRVEVRAPAAEPSAAPVATPFWTKHAYFVPSQFGDLPGWLSDNLADAWKAFRQSCVALVNRSAWSGACSRASRVDARADPDIRHFLEREFTLYEIRNTDRSPTGVITGYYEPLLMGSPRFDAAYPYPVYGLPGDLLFLDSRAIPPGGGRVLARVEGRSVIPVCVEQESAPGCQAPYVLYLGDAAPDIRDKKMRVRIDGTRIVPYYTRKEIEQGALPESAVIAWVDNAATLYSMHVQGSGKLRMPDGRILRLAYAEQNGHPFTPPVRKTVRTRGLAAPPEVLMRGFDIPLIDEGNELAAVAQIADPSPRPAVRGLRPLAETVSAPNPATGKGGQEELSPEVARMVELLLHGTPGTKSDQASAAPASTTAIRPARIAPEQKPGKPTEPLIVKFPGKQKESVWTSDPSFVFFRPIPDSDGGPVGALGVPLTPGRSIAVDPRTTPLGSPVFVSTEGALPDTRVNRLMFAQDTGGAIRGAVRADYFWGFGPGAFERASRMKESGRMWLLLPKDLRVAATPGVLTRGISNRSGGTEAECLIPDPELCVE